MSPMRKKDDLIHVAHCGFQKHYFHSGLGSKWTDEVVNTRGESETQERAKELGIELGKDKRKRRSRNKRKGGNRKLDPKKKGPVCIFFIPVCLCLGLSLRQKGHLSCAESSTVLSVVVQKMLDGINKKTAVYVVMSSGEWVSVTVLQFKGIDANHLFLWSFP